MTCDTFPAGKPEIPQFQVMTPQFLSAEGIPGEKISTQNLLSCMTLIPPSKGLDLLSLGDFCYGFRSHGKINHSMFTTNVVHHHLGEDLWNFFQASKKETQATSQACRLALAMFAFFGIDIFSLHLKQASNQSGRYVATPKRCGKNIPKKNRSRKKKIYQTIKDPNDLRHVCFLWHEPFWKSQVVFFFPAGCVVSREFLALEVADQIGQCKTCLHGKEGWNHQWYVWIIYIMYRDAYIYPMSTIPFECWYTDIHTIYMVYKRDSVSRHVFDRNIWQIGDPTVPSKKGRYDSPRWPDKTPILLFV